eukprot:4079115-Prorocentrum_lima.AAC.1
MTSSLVGSEMCIRDRLVGQSRPDSPTLTHRGPRVYKTAQQPNMVLRQETCLLYTSDAADDM